MGREILGRCIKCGGVIYNVNGEIDRSDCICDRICRCGYPALRSECGNAVGDEGCLGDPVFVVRAANTILILSEDEAELVGGEITTGRS